MRLRPRTPAPLLLVCVAALAGWCVEALGFRVNTSPSVPVGLYLIRQTSITKEGLVAACLPKAEAAVGRERGYLRRGECPGGASPVVKRVGARSGDHVQVTTDGVFVNGRRLQDPAPAIDSRGRSLASVATGDYELGAGELWLYSPHSSSWDSRFFGPVSVSAVLGTVRPIWARAPSTGAEHTDSHQPGAP